MTLEVGSKTAWVFDWHNLFGVWVQTIISEFIVCLIGAIFLEFGFGQSLASLYQPIASLKLNKYSSI